MSLISVELEQATELDVGTIGPETPRRDEGDIDVVIQDQVLLNRKIKGVMIGLSEGYYEDTLKSHAINEATFDRGVMTVDNEGYVTLRFSPTAHGLVYEVEDYEVTGRNGLSVRPGGTITPSNVRQMVANSSEYTSGAIYVDPIPSEYIVPSGTLELELDESGTITEDVSNYASVSINLVAITDAEIDALE